VYENPFTDCLHFRGLSHHIKGCQQIMEKRATQDNYIDLVDTGQFLVVEEVFAERRTDDPTEMVIRAEVAMYFGRLHDSYLLLEQVMKRIGEIDVAARFSLAKGQLALLMDSEEEAQTLLQSAYYFYLFHEEPFGIARSLVELAKVARKKGELEQAGEKLIEAQEQMEGRSNRKAEFLRGLITAELATLLIEKGEIDQATATYEDAARLLKNYEKGRYYGQTLAALADLKYALGEYQDSLDIYKEANTVFERYDLKQERADTQLRLAIALSRLKRYERAEKLATDSKDLQSGHPAGESFALAVLSALALQQNELDEATASAKKAVELSDHSHSTESKMRARIALGQVNLATHEFKAATEVLQEAIEIAHTVTAASRIRLLELEATLGLAEAYHNLDTRAGRAQLVRASELINTIEDAWLGDEYNRVSSKYEEQILFTDDNRLVFDGTQLPRWHEAKRTLEGFLLRNALRQTNNSLTRAARKLGVSKVHVHNLKKKHDI
jgi:tetratricopeptide (TPR) repeat protein